MEYGLRAGVLQFRLRGGGGRCSLRHVLGRRHVRVHSSSIVVVRCGGAAAHLGQGEPVWADANYLVDGPGWAHVAATVEDCAITLQPICGYDPKDPNTADVPVPDFRKALTGRLPAGESGKGFRVGVVKELIDDEQVTPEVRKAFWRAVEMLVDLGAEVGGSFGPAGALGASHLLYAYVRGDARAVQGSGSTNG